MISFKCTLLPLFADKSSVRFQKQVDYRSASVLSLHKMTSAHVFFVSPFDFLQSNKSSERESWKPAFSDHQSQYNQGQNFLHSSSYAKSKDKSEQQMLVDIEDISQFDGLDLQDLQNIDISLPEPVLMPQQHEDNDIPQTYEDGCILSAKKLVGNSRDEDWLRRMDKIISARAFSYRGYGINFLKEEIKTGQYDRYTLDQSKFKSMSGSMVREVFRRLQSFLLRDCRQKLKNLSGYEMKMLQTLLLNCRNTLPPYAAKSFIIMVKITYSLEDVRISQREALTLYDAIIKALKKKIGVLRGNSSYSYSESEDSNKMRGNFQTPFSHPNHPRQIDFDVTAEGERSLIKEYITEQSYSKIRDNVRFERGIAAITVKEIRNTLRRVLRGTIRRIEALLNEGVRELRQICKFSDQQIKWLIQSGECLEGRKQLCRAYLQERQDKKYLEGVYQELKVLLAKKDSAGYHFRGSF